MIKHTVIWDLKDELSPEERSLAARKIKEEAEALAGMPGVKFVKVYIEPVLTSNCGLMLDSEMENEEAFNAYQIHPAHVELKNYIASVTKSRKCFDGEK